MEGPRRYARPPLIEAVAEFRFPPGELPDAAVPGLLYRDLRDEFPTATPAVGIEAQVRATGGSVQQHVYQKPRLRLARHDGRVLVQIGPTWLAVNHLAPYSGWAEFAPIVGKVLDAYRDVAGTEALLGASLRYINQLEVPPSLAELGRYLRVRPETTAPWDQECRAFMLGLQFHRDEGNSLFQLEVQPIQVEGKPSAVRMDLTYQHIGQPLQHGDAMPWLHHAHEAIGELFEAAITDEARKSFQPVEE